MMIEYEMNEENEKSYLYYQSIMINQRMIIFRIMLINHEFFINSMIINQREINDNNQSEK